jgi:hypothetical protein
LDSEAFASPSEATLDGQLGSIHAQSEAGEAGEGIFRINEPKVTAESPQASDTMGIDMRDVIAENRENIYRVGRTDRWACKYCKISADRQFMSIHRCSKSRSKVDNGAAKARINRGHRRP